MSLHAESLACERNGRVVFSNLSFDVKPGECAELRGPNGAGKSSLLRVVAGLVPVTQGQLRFEQANEFKTSLHYIAHHDAIKSSLTVAENLQFWCDVLGGSSIEPALEAFSLTALKHEPAQLLSAGQRRRLSLSRLCLKARSLWLLDEPMTALDQATQNLLRHHMAQHLRDNGTLLVATHGDLGFTPHHLITLGSP
jgi:heme exporter protein A